MGSKKHKLSVSIDENYCLLGIVSDEPDYKLCWLINEGLKFSLGKTDNLLLFNKKIGEEQVYTLFQYDEEATMLTYRLISNRGESGYFLPELKHIDYVLHIQGELVPEDIKDLIKKILKVHSIRMCVPVDLTKIKDRERLQLW